MKKEIKAVGSTNVAGVYKITDIDGVVLYIGSSVECGDSLSRHKGKLKRQQYANNSKCTLQEEFNNRGLLFSVIKISASNSDVRDMTKEQKANLQIALGKLEEFYISLHKDTILNKHTRVTKSTSSPTPETTLKRQLANMAENNPNCTKFTEEDIRQIKQLLVDGISPKEIADRFNTSVGYISQIKCGYKWASVEIA